MEQVFKEMMRDGNLIYGKYLDKLSAAGHGKVVSMRDGQVFAVVCHHFIL